MSDEDIAELPITGVNSFEIPDWLHECRVRGMTEEEIQIVIRHIGREREVLINSSYEDLHSLPLPIGTHQKSCGANMRKP